MTSALRHIHSAGLACRTLDPTKILVLTNSSGASSSSSGGNTSKRLLLNCGGIFDLITHDPSAANPMGAMAHFQQEDLIALGKIVLGKRVSKAYSMSRCDCSP